MSFEKVVIQQNQEDGSYLELYPKTDSFTKKETLLSTTSVSYDLPESAVPDDVFQNIRVRLNLIGSGQAYLALTLLDSSGNKRPNIKVSGFIEGEVYSDDNGMVKGYITANGATLKVSGYADIADNSIIITANGGEFVAKTLTLTSQDFLNITSSTSYMFSPNVLSVDVSVGGAGGAGKAGSTNSYGDKVYGGAGGSMGAVTIQTGIKVDSNVSYSAVIGAGNSGAGGASSFLNVVASGGALGGRRSGSRSTGYTSDWDGENGASGTQEIYSSMTTTTPYGGSGGGGGTRFASYSAKSYGIGRSPGGGKGGSYRFSGEYGKSGLGGGGGGGGAESKGGGDDKYSYEGGHGGSGVVAIRMHLKNT